MFDESNVDYTNYYKNQKKKTVLIIIIGILFLILAGFVAYELLNKDTNDACKIPDQLSKDWRTNVLINLDVDIPKYITEYDVKVKDNKLYVYQNAWVYNKIGPWYYSKFGQSIKTNEFELANEPRNPAYKDDFGVHCKYNIKIKKDNKNRLTLIFQSNSTPWLKESTDDVLYTYDGFHVKPLKLYPIHDVILE